VRAFLAIDLPEDVREAVGAFAAGARRDLRGWRWSASPFHLTLRFLGEVGEEFLERAVPRWREDLAPCSAPSFRLAGLGVFPVARAPRVLWIGIEEEGEQGRLRELVRRIEQVCVSEGLPPETRPFRPHLTLARAARGARPELPSPALRPSFGPVRAGAVTLFRSVLRPQGAEHAALDRFVLERP
jgi:2'-5' RNA ligase